MKPNEQTCDPKRIDDYLEERLGEPVASEFERHLCDCERCRNELQRRSAEPDIWRDAVALLRPDSGINSAPDSSRNESLAYSEQYRGLEIPRSYENDRSSSGDPTAREHNTSQRERYVQSVLDSLAPTDDPEMLGRVGDYEISGVVGVGGMGAVLKGFDKSLRRVVAIKVMAPHLAHSGSARTRFQREARAAAAITHDNVIDIYAVAEAGGLPYLVMPYARGPSLQKRIDDGGPLGVVEVVRIGRQIAAGLAAAHEQGVVHRDIKPANILLSDGIERLWITDFGVARAMDDASMTQTGVIAGTPQYMSPEQARGESVDHRSDLFSLGSVLYTACTGRPPFRSEAAYGILRRITDSDPRPIREINSEIPEWLCAIIARLLAKHPADRFENAREVVDLFDGCLAHLQQPLQVELPQSIRSERLKHNASPHNTSAPQTKPTQPVLSSRKFFSNRGIIMTALLLLAALLGLLTTQVTNPVDISGHWTGENWQHVSLASVDEASDWYSGTFVDSTGRRGVVRLEWSRLQRRYNGRWKVGEAESGEITLRSGENGILRGAVSVDPESQLEPGVPRLLEFAWQPASQQAQQDFESQAVQQAKSPENPLTTEEIPSQVAVNSIEPKGAIADVFGPKTSSSPKVISAFGAALELANRLHESRLKLASVEKAIGEGQAELTAGLEELIALRGKQGQTKEDDELEGERLTQKIQTVEAHLRTIEQSINALTAERKLAYAARNDAQSEQKKILEALKEQLSSHKQALNMRKATREAMQLRYKLGGANDMELKQVEQSLAEAESQARQIELLVRCYESLGKN
ncbi:protein kinase domain-containing protein [Pirellulaceae bacterium SH449]